MEATPVRARLGSAIEWLIAAAFLAERIAVPLPAAVMRPTPTTGPVRRPAATDGTGPHRWLRCNSASYRSASASWADVGAGGTAACPPTIHAAMAGAASTNGTDAGGWWRRAPGTCRGESRGRSSCIAARPAPAAGARVRPAGPCASSGPSWRTPRASRCRRCTKPRRR